MDSWYANDPTELIHFFNYSKLQIIEGRIIRFTAYMIPHWVYKQNDNWINNFIITIIQ